MSDRPRRALTDDEEPEEIFEAEPGEAGPPDELWMLRMPATSRWFVLPGPWILTTSPLRMRTTLTEPTAIRRQHQRLRGRPLTTRQDTTGRVRSGW